MAESLLLPVVRGVIGKAGDELVQNITRMWGVDDDRDKLERQLLAVQGLLLDAEVKAETNDAVRRWMKALKAAAYQADDVLDDFQYEALRREAHNGESIASKVPRCFSLQSPLLHRLTVSRKMNKVLKKINELVTEMRTFGLLERAQAPQPLYRDTHAALDESTEIFGRDGDKEEVVKILLDQQDQKNVQVLPIIGMGGLGKTTLAKMVYNDSRVQSHFDLKMWHCVSENFEAAAIVRSVIELATNGKCDLPNKIEQLRRRLEEVIGQKRYLLILDDVWNEEQKKWGDDLKPLLCSSNYGLGSMIVVTSRSGKVADIMRTLPAYGLKCLREDDSWKLFSNKAFSKGVQEQPELVTIGKHIVNRCKGLPLALKTMGGLMSSRPTVQEWKAILKANMGDGKDEIMSILKLSYRYLSPEMKQCFAFCAVFPKDYVMEKDELIQLWIANGFIHEEPTTQSLVHKAELFFNELSWRSFFDDVKVRKFYLKGVFAQSYNGVGCTMHDLMHDLAKDVTCVCSSATELNQEKTSIKDVQHMQVSGKEFEEASGLLKGTSSLRTLLVQSKYNDIKKIKLMSLRALCCRDPCIIDCQLIKTVHLRYLDLSGSDIVSLPNSLCKLYNLLSLRLNGCRKLQYLPKGMATLRKLEHLYLLGCKDLKQMPPKLGQLHNLRTLTKFIVDKEYGCGIEELENLRHLGNRLELYNLRKVKCGSKANLHEKQNLNELLLCWDSPVSDYYEATIDKPSDEEQVLESLVPHAELEILQVRAYGGLKVSGWMRNPQMFRCLRELTMKSCRRCQDLPVVWLSSSLEYLSVSFMKSLTTLCKNIGVEAEACSTSLQLFPKLKRLKLSFLPKLERWVENGIGKVNGSVIFPQLEFLDITLCPKLESLVEMPVLTQLALSGDDACVPMCVPLGSLLSLQCLLLFGDNSFLLQLKLQDYLVSMERLTIHSCSSIVRWPMDELRCLPHLQELRIMSCSKLEGKDSSSEEEEILPLPQLRRLTIGYCDSLIQIPKLPASLKEIDIWNNKSLEALPSNLGDLVQLRRLELLSCSAMKALPNGMDGLTSLESLIIRDCPGIEKFPQDLLHQIPALKCIYIDVGGMMVRRESLH